MFGATVSLHHQNNDVSSGNGLCYFFLSVVTIYFIWLETITESTEYNVGIWFVLSVNSKQNLKQSKALANKTDSKMIDPLQTRLRKAPAAKLPLTLLRGKFQLSFGNHWNEYWADFLHFARHAEDGASLSGLDHSFTRIASSAAAAACSDESWQHFNLPRNNKRIS